MAARTTVAIDTRDLKKGDTGTYTYLKELCNEFKKQEGEVAYVFVNYWLPVYKGKNIVGKITEHILFTIWKQLILPIYCIVYKPDVLFCTDYFLPLVKLSTKKVVVFHDTFFYEQPEHYNSLWLKTFHWFAVKAAHKASQIIVPTHYVKNRLAFYMPLVKEKITVVYEGPKSFNKKQDKAWEEKISGWLNGSNYILHVGTLDHRKNLVRLVEAYDILLKNTKTENSKSFNEQENPTSLATIKLIIAGDSPTYAGSNGKVDLIVAINKLGLQKEVLLTGRITDAQLSYLYQQANAYVFPSLNEGFGLPLVEAMQYQVPTAAANNTALTEVGADAAIYFDPKDTKQMAVQIEILLNDQTIRTQLKKAAQDRMKIFNWKHASETISGVFIKLKEGAIG